MQWFCSPLIKMFRREYIETLSDHAEETLMLALSGQARIFLCNKSIDLRKGFEGLSAIVITLFEESLTSGAYFVFLNKTRDRMKVLYWDIDGLAIWYKRLEKGRFKRSNGNESLMERREFLMLLEGITPKRLQKRFRIS
jgi:transposase